MNLSDKSLEAILRSEAFDYALRLILHYGYGPDVLTVKPIKELDEGDADRLRETAVEALLDCAVEVESYEAEQDKGAYDINIMGVPGAYYIQAPEYEDMGFFETLEEARKAVRSRYGEFLLS
jgi:hypothetical protein